MTRITPPWRKAPTQSAEWFNVDALLPNQYAKIWVLTAAGSYIHAFAPLQTIAHGTQKWKQVEKQFGLHCMIDFLPPEQINSVTQTVRQFFANSVEGQEIVASHSDLPCFSEESMSLYTPDALQMDLFGELVQTTPEEVAHPLPDSVVTAFENLNAGTTPPDPDVLRLAKSWAESLYSEIKTQEGIWIDPHLTVQDGDVVFEWWEDRKSLTVYVSSDGAWFLESAGTDSVQTEGYADSERVRQDIWRWLTQ